jgi:hypothetical protein
MGHVDEGFRSPAPGPFSSPTTKSGKPRSEIVIAVDPPTNPFAVAR